MLHRFDDFAVHQTPQPLLHVATESPNAYDRYFFGGASADGEVFFAVAAGVYPNRRVMDATVSVVRRGRQHNLRASRAAPADRTATNVGPITVEVVEPMREHRIRVADGHGLTADLTMTAISPVVEEPRFVYAPDGLVMFDYTRLTQFGRWTGWIELDGERIDITPNDGVVGTRDRSWGVRPIGDPIPRPPTVPQFFWLWTPTVFEDCCTHFAVNDDPRGRPWHASGAVVPALGANDDPLDPTGIERAESVAFDVTWRPGTRWADRVDQHLRMADEEIEISFEPVFEFQMVGLGYRHPEWGHGRWVGDQVSTRDEIVLADVDPTDPLSLHVQALARATWGERTGIAVVEQLAIGPHDPSGLTGIIDPA